MIAPGAKVNCLQVDGTWIVKHAINDTYWQLIRRSDDGHHYVGRIASKFDLVELEPPPSFTIGSTITRDDGVLLTVASDDGDTVEFVVGASRHPLKRGGHLHLAEGNQITLPKPILVLATF